MGMTAKESAKAEILARVGRYKKAPSISALRARLVRAVGDSAAVEECVAELIAEGRLRTTDGLFYLPPDAIQSLFAWDAAGFVKKETDDAELPLFGPPS